MNKEFDNGRDRKKQISIENLEHDVDEYKQTITVDIVRVKDPQKMGSAAKEQQPLLDPFIRLYVDRKRS